MKKLTLLACLLAGMAFANTKWFDVKLYHPSVIGGTELQPGNYTAELKDQKLIVKHGRETVEASVRVENADRKVDATTVRYSNGDGKYKVEEIQLGGTKMKLVLY